MDPAATVHVATAGQVPVGHRQGWTAQRDTQKHLLRTTRTHHIHLLDHFSSEATCFFKTCFS